VLDVTPVDVVVAADGQPDGLTDDALARARAVTAVATPSPALARRLLGEGVPARAVPTPWFGSANPFDDPPEGRRVIGWHLGLGGRPDPSLIEAVSGVVEPLVRAGTALEIVGDPDAVPGAVATLDGVSVTRGGRADRNAHWAVLLWTPDLTYTDLADGVAPLVEAGRAGVPVLGLTGDPSAARLGLPGEHRLPPDPTTWRIALHQLLDDSEERARAARAVRAAIGEATGAPRRDDAVRRLIRLALDAPTPDLRAVAVAP
jgi:hypothetical protein